MDVPVPRSSVPGLAWPGLPGTAGVTMFDLHYQLEQSQWWPPEVVRQQQVRLIQRRPDEIEVTPVVEKTLSGEQEGRLRAALNRHPGHPFAYRFIYVDEIPRSAIGKFEDFRVELESQPPVRTGAGRRSPRSPCR